MHGMTTFTDAAQRFIDRFKRAYYETGKNTIKGQLALGRCACSIAVEFSSDYPTLDPSTIAHVALNSLLEAPTPDESANYNPVKREGLEIMAAAMEYGMPVYIWTVGDTGKYHDYEKDIHDPAYDYQQVKITKGRIKEQVEAIVNKDTPVEFTVNTSPDFKEYALREILNEAENNGIQEVFIADDLSQNEEIVNRLIAEYPNLKIIFWLIKVDDDTEGNLRAYRDSVLPQLRKNAESGTKTAIVFDLDDTLFDTQGSLNRAAVLTKSRLDTLHQSL